MKSTPANQTVNPPSKAWRVDEEKALQSVLWKNEQMKKGTKKEQVARDSQA